MEGLTPSPPSGVFVLEVPYLRSFSYKYSEGSFLAPSHLEQDGNMTLDNFDAVESLLSDDQASWLQARLFFGLICEFLGRQIDESHFISRTADGVERITVHLIMPDLISGWAASLSHMPRKDRASRLTYLKAVLQSAATESEQIDIVATRLDNIEQSYLGRILLSIKLLLYYLHSILEDYAEAHARESLHQWIYDIRISGIPSLQMNNLLTHRAKAKQRNSLPFLAPGGKKTPSVSTLLQCFEINGWCPVRALQVCQFYTISIASYLSCLRRDDGPHVSHEMCPVEKRCVAYDLSSQVIPDHISKHVTPTCDCSHLTVDQNRMTEIIQKGQIPILSMLPDADDLSIKLHVNDGLKPYSAISHVWSDGRGNPLANSLPKCQLRKIAYTLLDVKEERRCASSKWELYITGKIWQRSKSDRRMRVYFWMDTLCIPVQPTSDGPSLTDTKLKAIRHITPIFEEAEQVLVLDSGIESLCPPTNKEQRSVLEDEFTARILGSKWVQRAWTLEEGALSRDCFFMIDRANTLKLDQLVLETRSKPQGELVQRKKSTGRVWPWSKGSPDQKRIQPRFRTPLRLLLAEPLNEGRKRALRRGLSRRLKKHFAENRSSQFVEAWNNLLQRSATKPDDPMLIFANLLDFNAASIARLPSKKQLPLILRSCQDLPLSLLYDIHRKAQPGLHPRDRWVPTTIDGDRLINSAVLKNDLLPSDNGGLIIDTTTCEPDSLLIWMVRSDVGPPSEQTLFCANDVSTGEKYVVELYRQVSGDEVPLFYENTAKSGYASASYICIIIDKATGTDSLNGYSGRGACLIIQAEGLKYTNMLRYDCALVAWSPTQWTHRTGSTSLPPQWSLTPLEPGQNLRLEYGRYLLSIIRLVLDANETRR